MNHLLIVDGHQGVREGLARRLGRVCVVTAVDNLDAAERVLYSGAPDAVIVDPKTIVPRADEALARLGRTGRPVIVLTSSLLDEEAEGLRHAAAAILYKGQPLSMLLDQVEAAIDRARYLPPTRTAVAGHAAH